MTLWTILVVTATTAAGADDFPQVIRVNSAGMIAPAEQAPELSPNEVKPLVIRGQSGGSYVPPTYGGQVSQPATPTFSRGPTLTPHTGLPATGTPLYTASAVQPVSTFGVPLFDPKATNDAINAASQQIGTMVNNLTLTQPIPNQTNGYADSRYPTTTANSGGTSSVSSSVPSSGYPNVSGGWNGGAAPAKTTGSSVVAQPTYTPYSSTVSGGQPGTASPTSTSVPYAGSTANTGSTIGTPTVSSQAQPYGTPSYPNQWTSSPTYDQGQLSPPQNTLPQNNSPQNTAPGGTQYVTSNGQTSSVLNPPAQSQQQNPNYTSQPQQPQQNQTPSWQDYSTPYASNTNTQSPMGQTGGQPNGQTGSQVGNQYQPPYSQPIQYQQPPQQQGTGYVNTPSNQPQNQQQNPYPNQNYDQYASNQPQNGNNNLPAYSGQPSNTGYNTARPDSSATTGFNSPNGGNQNNGGTSNADSGNQNGQASNQNGQNANQQNQSGGNPSGFNAPQLTLTGGIAPEVEAALKAKLEQDLQKDHQQNEMVALFFMTLGLIASMAFNCYLGYVVWNIYHRYRMLATDLRSPH